MNSPGPIIYNSPDTFVDLKHSIQDKHPQPFLNSKYELLKVMSKHFKNQYKQRIGPEFFKSVQEKKIGPDFIYR